MSRYMLALYLVLCLTGLTASAASDEETAPDQYGVKGPHHMSFIVAEADGRVLWVEQAATIKGLGLWLIDDLSNAVTLRVRRGKWRGWYLSFDPTGKRKTVFLSKKPTKGSYWWLDPNKVKYGTPNTIRASAGKLKGWYLDVGGKGDDKTYRAVLFESPPKIPKFPIDVIAP